MANLPLKQPWEQAQTTWSTAISPVLDSPTATPVLLKNVVLKVGDNTVNHLLGQKLVGWQIARMRGAFSQVFDKQDNNPTPQLTLVLNASVAVTIDLLVY